MNSSLFHLGYYRKSYLRNQTILWWDLYSIPIFLLRKFPTSQVSLSQDNYYRGTPAIDLKFPITPSCLQWHIGKVKSTFVVLYTYKLNNDGEQIPKQIWQRSCCPAVSCSHEAFEHKGSSCCQLNQPISIPTKVVNSSPMYLSVVWLRSFPNSEVSSLFQSLPSNLEPLILVFGLRLPLWQPSWFLF